MQTVLLTGATGGIGNAIRTTLTNAGSEVISVTHENTDLENEAEVEALKESVLKAHQRIDWIIAAHGYITDTETPETVEKTFASNTLSLFSLARAFLPHVPDGGGMIALTSSAGLAPNGRYPAYSSSKAAANAFMQALAKANETKKFYAVAPGPTNTLMRERIAHDAATKQDPQVVGEVVRALIEGSGTYRSGDVILVKDNEVSIPLRLA